MITIETINGKPYTVVWHELQYCQHVFYFEREDCYCELNSGVIAAFNIVIEHGEFVCNKHIATALPALPRYPKNDEATIRLLHLYAVHGVKIWGLCKTCYGTWEVMAEPCVDDDTAISSSDGNTIEEITHATFNGERVDIARTDGGE